MIATRFLAQLLETGEVPAWCADTDLEGPQNHAIRRLLAATRNGVTGLDWAVLVRHCLRRLPSNQQVTVRRLNGATLALLQKVDVNQALDGTLAAQAYRPAWISDLGEQELDLPRFGQADSGPSLLGEKWLRRLFGEGTWKSEAQRDAAWRALNAPANSTLLIGLPTGAGKSLVYQCCAAFESGLTVLVVPTVALGIDQRAAVQKLPCAPDWNPLLYTPGEDPDSVLNAVQSRRCRLLITSPEAIVAGRLRGLLRQHAEQGFLQRLVVDEAHLVESWGADFRIEFQLLGVVLREWRSLAPKGIRALLLSATFAPSTPGMLKDLFAGEEGTWDELIVQRLRPEIHYFATPNWVARDEQIRMVREALLRLPRPAILYVTAVKDAVNWAQWLRDDGLERLEVFHGNTPGDQRKTIMQKWRDDQLDLVVATSAFGMGVDKADVKAVVHACFPEGVDRFYQEVGRGGRDGEPCISLLVPTRRDDRIARNLGPALIRDSEKINGRWRAMWESRKSVSDKSGNVSSLFRLRTEVQPFYRLGTESFSENTNWNKRLLLMMDRANLIYIESLTHERSQTDADSLEFAVVRLLVPSLQLEAGLPRLLAGQRQEEIKTIQRAMHGLQEYFRREAPVCKKLRSHYGPATLRACGSCGFCRTQRERPVAPAPLRFNPDGVMTKPSVQVVQAPALNDIKSRAILIQALRQVIQGHRIKRIVVSRVHRAAIETLLERADDDMASLYRIDDLGPDGGRNILPDEAVLVLHVDVVDASAGVYNRHGRSVAHWVFGGTIESVPGRWHFMHEHHARAYPGQDGLTQWLYDMRRLTALPSTYLTF